MTTRHEPPVYEYQQHEQTSASTTPAPADPPEGFAMRFDDFDLLIASEKSIKMLVEWAQEGRS